jgi:hypothetical protein
MVLGQQNGEALAEIPDPATRVKEGAEMWRELGFSGISA